MKITIAIPFGVRLGSRYKVRTVDFVHLLLQKLAEQKIPVICVDENRNIHILRIEDYDPKQHYLKLSSTVSCSQILLMLSVENVTIEAVTRQVESMEKEEAGKNR